LIAILPRTRNEGLAFSLANIEEDVKRKQRKIDALTQQLDLQNAEIHKLKEKKQMELYSSTSERVCQLHGYLISSLGCHTVCTLHFRVKIISPREQIK
jgi:hypothetical protein